MKNEPMRERVQGYKSRVLWVKKVTFPKTGCPRHGNMAMSLQLVIQILVGRENLPKALTLPGRRRRRRGRRRRM